MEKNCKKKKKKKKIKKKKKKITTIFLKNGLIERCNNVTLKF